MTTDKYCDKIINQIENRLQFVITITVFFLALFNQSLFAGSIIVAVYIVDYILFEAFEEKFSVGQLKFFNTLLLIGIGSFILPVMVVALSTQKDTIPNWQAYTLMGGLAISIWAILAVPAIIFLSITILRVKASIDGVFGKKKRL